MSRSAKNCVFLSVVLMLLVGFAPAMGEEIPSEKKTREQIAKKYPGGLPAYLTEEEKQLPRLPVEESRGAPTGTVHCPAEYEYNDGILFAWNSYTTVITSMIVPMTTLSDESTAYVIVDSSSEQSSAYNTLNSAGADMDQVEFIVRSTDTVWIRDYGPRFIFEDGVRAIVDHTYNRPRPNDNTIPSYIGSIWGETVYNIGLEHGGGNFHLFADGDAFMSELILNENPGLTEQQVIDKYADYQGLNLTIMPPFPSSFDSTQHIDMWMLPVADKKIIIGEYSSSAGTPYTVTEDAVDLLESRGYTVYRTPGWNSGGTHYTYTNAVIFNDMVFMPSFGGSYTSQDAQAKAVFETAFGFPSDRVIQVNCSSIIQAAGAIHCIVMHVPGIVTEEPSIRLDTPNGGEHFSPGSQLDITWTARDNNEVTGIDIWYSTDSGATFPHVIATGEENDGVFSWTTPEVIGDSFRVKVVARDADLNSAQDISEADFKIAPGGLQRVHYWDMETDPGWYTEGNWAWGVPTGGGQDTHGNPDPTAGYNGRYVYGYALDGDYEGSMSERDLTTTAIDCTGLSGTTLKFQRWLGVEQPSYDHAYIRISNDGASWHTVWQNTATVDDGAWVAREYDVSTWADNHPVVYVRWTMGTTDSSWNFCGWNIDEVEIVATMAEAGDGDFDDDGDVDLADFAVFQTCFTDDDDGVMAAVCGDADLDGDLDVDLEDYAAFAGSM